MLLNPTVQDSGTNTLQLSVIVPVFNTPPEFLLGAVDSVLSDPLTAQVQLILVDDASTNPGTLEMLGHLRLERRVLLLRNERNLGPASSRNRGLAAATEDWVAFLDADDFWLPEQLTLWQGMLAQQPDARWLATRHVLLMADGVQAMPPRLEGANQVAPGLRQLGGPELTRALLANFWLHLGTMLIRRELAELTGGFADGIYYAEDIHFMARLSTLTPLLLSESAGYSWRRGGDSLTTSPRRLRSESLRVYQIAARDPLLRTFRKEIRWAYYSAMKGLALNNLLAGRRWHALACALTSWRMDPREWRDMRLFVGLLARHPDADPQEVDRCASQYSSAEVFVVKPTATVRRLA